MGVFEQSPLLLQGGEHVNEAFEMSGYVIIFPKKLSSAEKNRKRTKESVRKRR